MNTVFSGKKIVITGASPDFGQILAIRFAQMGAELFLVARTKKKAEETAALVRTHVVSAVIHCYGADLRYPADISSMFTAMEKDTPLIDILINNAGYWLQGDFLAANDLDISQAISSTLSGTILITKAIIPLLNRSKNADIVNISSLSAQIDTTEPAHEAYTSAKSGMGTFATRLRESLHGSGIRITTVFPPKFLNHTPLKTGDWKEPVDLHDKRYVNDRHVFDAIKLALTQDRICCLSEIYISNNATIEM